MKIGMNLLLWSTHITNKQFHLFAEMKKTGYDGVEIPIFQGKVPHYTKIGRELKNQGLACTSVTVATEDANPISPSAACRRAALDRLKWAIDCSAATGSELLCGPYHQPLGVFSGKPPTNTEKQRAADVHRKAAAYAQQAGLRMGIEYLNRFECYFLTTMKDAVEHVKRVGHPSFGTMYDTFHANIEEKDGPAALKKAGKAVFHFHVSENDRGTPGAGHVPFLEAFRVLRKMKYDGWLTIEAFGRALPDLAAATKVWRDFFPSRQQVYKKGLVFVKDTWKKAAR